jgi:hypothetical protein
MKINEQKLFTKGTLTIAIQFREDNLYEIMTVICI